MWDGTGPGINIMSFAATGRGRFSLIVMALTGFAVMAGVSYAIFGVRSDATASSAVSSPEITASISPVPSRNVGKSGLPLPRFVSLKTDRVNVRRGPSSEHGVSWVFTRKELPVEIVAEFDHWRRVRDADGEEGWIYQSLLAGRRTAMIAPWRQGNNIAMMTSPDHTAGKVAHIRGGVVGRIKSCNGDWCSIDVEGYNGWIEQAMLWGVYPGEQIN